MNAPPPRLALLALCLASTSCDGGLVPTPQVQEGLSLVPGDRLDVLVDGVAGVVRVVP